MNIFAAVNKATELIIKGEERDDAVCWMCSTQAANPDLGVCDDCDEIIEAKNPRSK